MQPHPARPPADLIPLVGAEFVADHYYLFSMSKDPADPIFELLRMHTSLAIGYEEECRSVRQPRHKTTRNSDENAVAALDSGCPLQREAGGKDCPPH
jgi:hypothetical protein